MGKAEEQGTPAMDAEETRRHASYLMGEVTRWIGENPVASTCITMISLFGVVIKY